MENPITRLRQYKERLEKKRALWKANRHNMLRLQRLSENPYFQWWLSTQNRPMVETIDAELHNPKVRGAINDQLKSIRIFLLRFSPDRFARQVEQITANDKKLLEEVYDSENQISALEARIHG